MLPSRNGKDLLIFDHTPKWPLAVVTVDLAGYRSYMIPGTGKPNMRSHSTFFHYISCPSLYVTEHGSLNEQMTQCYR